jgi:hypothetical protein
MTVKPPPASPVQVIRFFSPGLLSKTNVRLRPVGKGEVRGHEDAIRADRPSDSALVCQRPRIDNERESARTGQRDRLLQLPRR